MTSAITLSSVITDITGALSSLWTFITGNPLLIGMVAAPFVIGLLAAFVSLFRK